MIDRQDPDVRLVEQDAADGGAAFWALLILPLFIMFDLAYLGVKWAVHRWDAR